MTHATDSTDRPWTWSKHWSCGPVEGWISAMSGKGYGKFRGFGPWAMFGHAPPWAHHWSGPPGYGRGPKARRGDIRAAILGILAEEPMNGYQIIQEVAERSRGAWKPSPGSIYPTLQQLEDEGLVRTAEHTHTSKRRAFELTDEGRAYVEAHPDEISAPWKTFTDAEEDEHDLQPLIAQAAAAMWQIMATGTPDQQARAREVLAEMRRRLYGILADGDETDDADGGGQS
ncbi:PadR family transcriptional regulator [Actinobacteria bacterium YIM 96077]|uniref:PadR family transcriptional regulator n=1 Tax=Phytoactinopolyspora halophila TaxID=1981511 RepID=A0A329QPC8_9ACTN|nr:PadR family transcriptional regulator [Phytoactinopolyspora halophila]AYY12609.1 PadR family transcriptional regulator [Actinobacteria bacterium YIM 96077]RAW12488.1 PadR family transcriptional regulator [Phytoactinopolyspora halophila]